MNNSHINSDVNMSNIIDLVEDDEPKTNSVSSSQNEVNEMPKIKRKSVALIPVEHLKYCTLKDGKYFVNSENLKELKRMNSIYYCSADKLNDKSKILQTTSRDEIVSKPKQVLNVKAPQKFVYSPVLQKVNTNKFKDRQNVASPPKSNATFPPTKSNASFPSNTAEHNIAVIRDSSNSVIFRYDKTTGFQNSQNININLLNKQINSITDAKMKDKRFINLPPEKDKPRLLILPKPVPHNTMLNQNTNHLTIFSTPYNAKPAQHIIDDVNNILSTIGSSSPQIRHPKSTGLGRNSDVSENTSLKPIEEVLLEPSNADVFIKETDDKDISLNDHEPIIRNPFEPVVTIFEPNDDQKNRVIENKLFQKVALQEPTTNKIYIPENVGTINSEFQKLIANLKHSQGKTPVNVMIPKNCLKHCVFQNNKYVINVENLLKINKLANPFFVCNDSNSSDNMDLNQEPMLTLNVSTNYRNQIPRKRTMTAKIKAFKESEMKRLSSHGHAAENRKSTPRENHSSGNNTLDKNLDEDIMISDEDETSMKKMKKWAIKNTIVQSGTPGIQTRPHNHSPAGKSKCCVMCDSDKTSSKSAIKSGVATKTKTVRQSDNQKQSNECRFSYLKSSAWDALEQVTFGFNEREIDIAKTCCVKLKTHLAKYDIDTSDLVFPVIKQHDFKQSAHSHRKSRPSGKKRSLLKYKISPLQKKDKTRTSMLGEEILDDLVKDNDSLYFTKKVDILDNMGKKLRTEHFVPKKTDIFFGTQTSTLFKNSRIRPEENLKIDNDSIANLLKQMKPCTVSILRDRNIDKKAVQISNRRKCIKYLSRSLVKTVSELKIDYTKPLMILNEQTILNFDLSPALCNSYNVLYIKKDNEKFPKHLCDNAVFVDSVRNFLIKVTNEQVMREYFVSNLNNPIFPIY